MNFTLNTEGCTFAEEHLTILKDHVASCTSIRQLVVEWLSRGYAMQCFAPSPPENSRLEAIIFQFSEGEIPDEPSPTVTVPWADAAAEFPALTPLFNRLRTLSGPKAITAAYDDWYEKQQALWDKENPYDSPLDLLPPHHGLTFVCSLGAIDYGTAHLRPLTPSTIEAATDGDSIEEIEAFLAKQPVSFDAIYRLPNGKGWEASPFLCLTDNHH